MNFEKRNMFYMVFIFIILFVLGIKNVEAYCCSGCDECEMGWPTGMQGPYCSYNYGSGPSPIDCCDCCGDCITCTAPYNLCGVFPCTCPVTTTSTTTTTSIDCSDMYPCKVECGSDPECEGASGWICLFPAECSWGEGTRLDCCLECQVYDDWCLEICGGESECNQKYPDDLCAGGKCTPNCQCEPISTSTTTTIITSCSGTNTVSCSYAGSGCNDPTCCYESAYMTCSPRDCDLIACDSSDQPCESCSGCSCSSGPPPTCFPAGTKITMADGSKKNIEDVREGEMVLSYDVETESYVSREVVFFDDAHKVGSEGHVEACAKLGNPPSLYTINDLIEFTPEHPFYVRENGETKWAALVPDMRQHPQKGDPEELKLKIGQEILINGKWVKIEKLGVSRENVPDTKVYNLIIEGTSTYIANDIVVHNKCCFLGGTQITMADDSMKNIEDVKIGDMVRSFDEKTGELVNREVLALQNPIREGYYNLHFGDNQLIQVTSEHPFYAKKQDGSVQWCSIEPEKTVEYYPHLTFVGQLEIGDFIYTDQEEWTEVKSWDWVEGPVQTYNLWNIEGTCTFFANGLLVHNRDGTTTTSVTTTTTIPPEDCDSDGDEDGDGDTNCEDSDCWGQPGPAGIICCDNPSHCAYNRGCVDECINNKCLYQIRGVCDDTECIGLPCCNGVSQDCLDPDDDQSICVNCQGEIWDPIKASSPRCCGDDPPGGPDENWCTLGGGSCIDGLWTDDHCDDFVKNCDEGDPWGLNLPDCGGVDCDECCRNCDCVDVSISQKIFTKTLVENYADVFLKNSDPSYRDLDVEVYLNNSEDLDNCFDKGCDPWEYHFEDELGNYLGHEYTTPIHLNNGEIKKIYFVFTPSGPTPVDKYIIQIGVRDVGTTGCP